MRIDAPELRGIVGPTYFGGSLPSPLARLLKTTCGAALAYGRYTGLLRCYQLTPYLFFFSCTQGRKRKI